MNVEYDLVRAYFEENGFWVRAKEISTEIGKNRFLFPIFEIFNSENSADFHPESFRIFTSDVTKYSSAVVSLIGWQDSGFSSDLLTSDSRIVKFLRKQIESYKVAWSEKEFSILRADKQLILILPAIPRSEKKAKELFEFFKQNKVQAVLTLSSVLENLLRRCSENQKSKGNSSFQLLRLLKLYGLATEPQLNIFD